MVPANSWKPDAVVRLLLSIFICFCIGGLVEGLLHHPSGKAGLKFCLLTAGALGFFGGALILGRRKWTEERLMIQVGMLLACLYLGLVFGAWAQHVAGDKSTAVPSVEQMLVTALSFQGATLVLVTLFLGEQRTGWGEAFGLNFQRRRALAIGLMIACIFLPIGQGLQMLSAQVLAHVPPHWNVRPEEQLPVQTLRLARTWGNRAVLGVVTILLAPLAEELLFRGVLYSWLKQAGFPRVAVWGTALVFAAVHVNAITFVPLMVLALVLAALYERTGNLLAPIAAHALFNGLNFAMLYLLERDPFGQY
jgi:membrane protease YdiL (CAAX protease family)